MDSSRFTLKSQEALELAQGLAVDHSNPSLETVHLLAALTQQKDTLFSTLLENLGISPNVLSNDISSALNSLPKTSTTSPENLTINPDIRKVFDQAFKEAKRMGDEYISVEHLLLALIQIPAAAQNILLKNNIGYDRVIESLKTLRGNQKVTDDFPESKY